MKHFFFDLDGTLFEDHEDFNLKAMAVLQRIEAEGYKYSFTTGRPKFYLQTKMQGKSCYPEFLSYCNGARVEKGKNGEKLFSRPFTKNEVASLQAEEEIQDSLFFMTEKEMTSHGAQLDKASKSYPFWVPDRPLDVVWQMTVRHIGFDLYEYLRKKYDFVFLRNYKGEDVSMDVAPKDISKGRALRLLLDEHVLEKEIFVFGDSYNDISNFEQAGVFRVAMNTAPEELKILADYVLQEDEGLLEVVSKIIAGDLG